jgi:AraC-like DNA-binding protein
MLQSGNSVITFSTDAFAPSDRFSMWRELFGRTVLNVDIEQNSSSPFRAWATIRKLPEVGLMTAYSSGVTYRRAPQRVNSDDVVFSFGAVEGAYARQRGRETWAKQGDALLMLAAEGTMVARNNDGYLNCVRVPRAALAARVRNVEDRYCRRIPGNLPAVQLLSRYVALLEGAETPQLQQSAATHVLDLIGLALGATRDASHAAGKRGLRAARLEVIKDDITRNLGDEALSVQTLSRRHSVSPRQLQRLFEEAGVTFTEYLIAQRLGRAHALVSDPARKAWTLTAIAFDAGFGDLSYFNRTFRRRYGASPSEVRAQALRAPCGDQELR